MTGTPVGRAVHDRRVLLGVVVALVAGVLAVGVGIRLSAGGGGESGVAEQAGATGTPCRDALVVGVDGNGERPASGDTFGPTVQGVVDRVVAKARRHGRSVAVRSVSLTTVRNARLVKSHAAGGDPARRSLSRAGLRVWRAPIAAGVRSAFQRVAALTAACPDRPVLLVGYAQGAAVVHRLLTQLAAHAALPGVIGGVLISDPDKVSRSVAHPVIGEPAARRRHAGILPLLQAAHPDVPRSSGSYAVWPACTVHDLVCDPSRSTVRDALAAARSYTRGPVPRDLAAAAWRQMALWPVPDPRIRVVTGAVGKPLDVQLAVQPGSPSSVAWGDATGLPGGVTLSPSGRVTGTPTRSGTYDVSYRVSGTAPTTTAHTGLVVVTVTPESVSLSAGGQVSCATRSDGVATCWGRNDFGQLGDGTMTRRTTPTRVLGTGWATISTSGSSTCGVKTDHTLWCWGLDNFGQLGIGAGRPVRTPHQVGPGHKWSQVASAWGHTCAVKTTGTLWCWGQNRRGQLGIGTIDRRHGLPQQVGTGTDWHSVTTGGWHSCALTTAGAAYCWGHNMFGEVGDGTVVTRTRPTPVEGSLVWLQLSAAWGQTCGITQDGTMQCWGFNRQGQLGDGTQTNRAHPTPVVGGRTWTQVTTGDGSTCATASDGRLWCWGDNRYGQLGQAPSDQPTTSPVEVAALTTPVQLTSAGWLHTCVIPVGGSFTCWGNNEAGQLGDGTTGTARALSSSRPIPPQGIHQVPLRRSDLPSDRRLEHATPREVAAIGLDSRPAARRSPSLARRSALTPFRVITMNELGSQHTAPSGDEPWMAPGRIRAEWASTYYRLQNASLVGTQESQPDQILALDAATRHEYKFFPGNSIGYAGAPQSLMWHRADWKMTWHSTFSIPFTSGWRPQPIVQLQQRSTGAQVYFLNVHFSARRAGQAQRNKSMKILLAVIDKLKRDHIPILLTGDFNQVAPAFCPITGKTPLVAATGGSNVNGRCTLPKGARIDWIFGSKGAFSNPLMDYSAQIQRTTDHHVLSALFGTG